MEILIAPFSNSAVRDWPIAHFSRLIGELLDRTAGDPTIRIVGTGSQMLRADAIVRPFSAIRVRNECGRHPWSAVQAALRNADCVIGNNSGLAHLAAALGTPTVCIFGGSHQRREWRPIGANVILVSRAIWCSPCHLSKIEGCALNQACLREIDPIDVACAVLAALGQGGSWPAESANVGG